jgi:hypothetical protein
VLELYGWDGLARGFGQWEKTRCPFHGADRTPSAAINSEHTYFHCFTCGVKGDAYALLMEREGMSFPDAKERVKEITGYVGEHSVGRAGGHSLGRHHVQAGSALASPLLTGSKLPMWARKKFGGKIV